MIRMPGYGDFLETIDPGVRQRHADAGAPEGFTDVVAQVMSAGEGEPSHWGVTFAVADADAAARAAVELGGEVASEPADAPWVRETVLRDPDGTRFTASQFVPPEAPAA
jgi:predicted enzyme related to lactoylglutathione lyase